MTGFPVRGGVLAAMLLFLTACVSDEVLFAEYSAQCDVPVGAAACPTPPPALPAPAPVVLPQLVQLERAVYFPYRGSDLDDDARQILDAFIAYLDANETVHLHLTARTDRRGNRAINTALGEARIASVRDYLIAAGVGAERLGSTNMADREATPDAGERVMANERRVDLDRVDASGRPLPALIQGAGAEG